MTDLVHGLAAERWGGWQWRAPSRGEHFRRCSYCGSIHPDDVVAEFERGATAQWADRKYGWPHKFYLSVTNRDPDALFWLGGIAGGRPRSPELLRAQGYIPVAELTAEQRAACEVDVAELDTYQGVMVGRRTSHFGKFYTAHLADPAIDTATKEAIALGSGLRVHFEDGRVRWEPAAPTS